MTISVTILTKNSQKYLKVVLEALVSFDEVIILDNGSSDETMAIAREFANCKIHESPFIGFGPLHNKAAQLASHDWILSIDSDEILSPELAREILATPLNPFYVYSLPRRTYYQGKWIKWCGWYPDKVVRLFNRRQTQFSNDEVHEKVLREGLREVPFRSPLIHHSYDCIADFLTKMQSYSSLFSKQNQGKKKSSIGKAILHSFFAFFKSYFLKKGFLGGYEGFLISVYNSHTAFYKYLKLYEANRKSKLPP